MNAKKMFVTIVVFFQNVIVAKIVTIKQYCVMNVIVMIIVNIIMKIK